MLDDQHRRPEFFADLDDQRTECLGLALCDPGGGFVEAQQFGVDRQQAGELNDAPSAS